jgi:hypothetical protein
MTLSYHNRPDGVSAFEYFLNRAIFCEGTGFEDEYLYKLTFRAREFINTLAIVECSDYKQYIFAQNTYTFLVLERQNNVFPGRIGDVDLDELVHAIKHVNAKTNPKTLM